MGETVLSVLAEFALAEGFKATKKGISFIIGVNSACNKLKATLNGLKLVVDEICESGLESTSEWQSNVEVFRGKHADGLLLVEECKKTSNRKVHKKFKYAMKIRELNKYLGDFIETNIQPRITLNIMILPGISRKLTNLSEDVKNIAAKMEINTRIENPRSNVEQNEGRHCVPNMPNYFVGFDGSVEELKELVLDTNVRAVGITGLSGMGKSTLATALCHHDKIKEHFQRVIYITVSKNPNIMDMLENMWEDIVGGSKPSFGNLDQAHNQLQVKINRISQPILVVLDDVCSRSNLQRLLFQGEHYKTLVTTRDENIIRKQNNVRLFPLQSLQEDHAMSLFCYHAFGEPTIPATATHYEELVKQVQAQCDGLPLALQVIGSSLRDEPSLVWKSAKNKLSRGASICEFHKEELLERLKTTSIDVLEDNVKQCFLDLAVFPQGRTFCVDVLLDIWVYVRGMDWMDAFVILIELIARSLLELKRDPSLSELKRDPWGPGITQECANGLLFSQHNVIRDLALYLVEQDKLSDCSRLCMPEKSDCIPSNWQTVHASKAQIVSIHTGTMDEKQWAQMEFPEAEALTVY